MNFYIGNTISELNTEDKNALISDELLGYLHKKQTLTSVDLTALFEIDPYSDAAVSGEDTQKLISIFEEILRQDILKDFQEKRNAATEIELLIKLAQEALRTGENLIVIGD